MADFCSRCGKTLSLIDPLLELKGLRFCEDCYPDVKREYAAASLSDKMDRKNRAAFSDDESDENLRGSIIKGKQALAGKADVAAHWAHTYSVFVAHCFRGRLGSSSRLSYPGTRPRREVRV